MGTCNRTRRSGFHRTRSANWTDVISAARGRRALPDLVIVVESPLVIFNQVPAQIWPTLDAGYVQAATFRGAATDALSRAVYDQQDAFYVPYATLSGVRRPGPTIRVFERRLDASSREP